MTSGPGAPPLPPPQPPAAAARAITEAAQAAADAWALPMEPAEHSRALSQLHSVLRDLGIATRGLARYQTAGHPADPAPPGFSQLVAASAERLLAACQNLDGVLAAEGLGAVPDPDEPGAMLCQAARTAITAWRQPAGTSAERDATVEQLITAIGPPRGRSAGPRRIRVPAPHHRPACRGHQLGRGNRPACRRPLPSRCLPAYTAATGESSSHHPTSPGKPATDCQPDAAPSRAATGTFRRTKARAWFRAPCGGRHGSSRMQNLTRSRLTVSVNQAVASTVQAAPP